VTAAIQSKNILNTILNTINTQKIYDTKSYQLEMLI